MRMSCTNGWVRLALDKQEWQRLPLNVTENGIARRAAAIYYKDGRCYLVPRTVENGGHLLQKKKSAPDIRYISLGSKNRVPKEIKKNWPLSFKTQPVLDLTVAGAVFSFTAPFNRVSILEEEPKLEDDNREAIRRVNWLVENELAYVTKNGKIKQVVEV